MFCPKCGNQIAESAKFCPSCGAQVAARQTPAHETPPRRKVPTALLVLLPLALLVAAGVGVWFALFAPYQLDERTFPDAGVRAAAAAQDADGDGALSREEARSVTSLTVQGAQGVSGLGTFFPNLEQLDVSEGAVSELDVSDLPGLTSLTVQESQPLQLNLSHNTGITELVLPNEVQVTGLEASNLTERWLISEVAEVVGGAEATHYSAEYDNLGRAETIEVTASEDGISNVIDYAYDEQGRVVSKSEVFSWRPGSRQHQSTVFSYDDEGRLVSAESVDSNMGEYYSYDEQGRLSWYGIGGVDDVTSNTYYTYNDQGLLESRSMRYKGTDAYVWQYLYDGEGRCIQETSDVGSDRESATHYELDDAGRVVRAYSTGPYTEGTSYPVSFAYDDEGRLASAESDLDRATYSIELSYGEDGRLVDARAVRSSTVTDYEITYTRRFLTTEQSENTSGVHLELGVPESPLLLAQHVSLMDVFAVPKLQPNPIPHLYPGDSLTLLF